MWQRIWLIILPLCTVSCAHFAPKISACISDPSVRGFFCYDEASKQSFFLRYEDSDRYLALSPIDAQNLLNYCEKQ